MTAATDSVRIKVASASLNQTVYDFSRNVPNILAAIDRAAADGADILALEELGLTGYAADDYHQWNKDNETVWPLIQLIASYAKDKNPNLVISLGAPWHYADKSLPVSDPAYNINNRPFNAQFTLAGGRVAAISVKSILADGPAEYEPRQFNPWPISKGTIHIELPDGSRVPFGQPIVMLKGGNSRVTLAHEICAEGWPGVREDFAVDPREQQEARHIAALSGRQDLSVVLNSSASKPQPAINKEHLRAEGLCKTGSQYCGLFVYTNCLGSGSGTYAAEGGQIFAQDGEIIHHGQRYSFDDFSYSSVAVDVPAARPGKPDATTCHAFHTAELGRTGAEAEFDKAFAAGRLMLNQLKYEEYMRSIVLWLRDYLMKQDWPCQGYVVSLSGGKDSAYGALAVSLMVDLEVREVGLGGFFQHFSHLKYKDEVLRVFKMQGEAAAVRAIKDRILTCVYLPGDNSSDEDLKAAGFLIQGGKLLNGTQVEGIGGRLQTSPMQRMLDEAIAAYAGLNLSQIAQDNWREILGNLHEYNIEDRPVLARAKLMREIKEYMDAELGSHPKLPNYLIRQCLNPIPTWANPADDTILQNIQARVRSPIPWTIANHESKMALVTSNQSEAVLGYTTAGGDMHMGGANPIGGVPKAIITESLTYFETHGLAGFPAIPSLCYVNAAQPSARLRKMTPGAAAQTDEADLGFTYSQADWLAAELIIKRRNPSEILPDMLSNPLFPDDPAVLRKILLSCATRWAAAQFKRIMGTLAPHVGSNVDPHQAVRTTVLGDHFKTGCAEMTLNILAEKLGGAATFGAAYHIPFSTVRLLSAINGDFKTALITWPLDRLLNPIEWQAFIAGNQQYQLYLRRS